jgi:hyperosmotically inducible protein
VVAGLRALNQIILVNRSRYREQEIGNMDIKKLLVLAILAASVSMTACEKKGPAEKAGEKIDEMAEKAGDAMDDAVDDVADAAEETCEEIKKRTGNKDMDCD